MLINWYRSGPTLSDPVFAWQAQGPNCLQFKLALRLQRDGSARKSLCSSHGPSSSVWEQGFLWWIPCWAVGRFYGMFPKTKTCWQIMMGTAIPRLSRLHFTLKGKLKSNTNRLSTSNYCDSGCSVIEINPCSLGPPYNEVGCHPVETVQDINFKFLLLSSTSKWISRVFDDWWIN